MKKTILLALVLLSSVAFADAPTYRASFTATGANPSVTVTPAVGDAIFVFTVSDQHASTDLYQHTATDDASGTYQDQYCGASWQHSNGKYAKLDVLMRGQLATSTTAIHISVGTSGKTAAVVAIAVSGMTAINFFPPFNNCGTLNPGSPNGTPGSVRQVKSNLSHLFSSGETPAVPWFGQTQAFLSTSMTFAVLADEQATPSVTAPSGWTQQATAGVGGSKPIGLSVSTRDSGFTGSIVTWGSAATATGNALVTELQPIQ